MNLFDQGLLDTPFGWSMSLLVGLAFGFWLERAGFGSSRKLASIFYLRDFAVVQVMFTAVATAALGLAALDVTGLFEVERVYRMETLLGPQIVGGLIFGAGFVAGGWCPGTALVGAASGKLDALAFLAASMLGSLVYAAFWPQLEPLQRVGDCGLVTLPGLFHVSAGVVAAVIVAVALVMFALIHRLELRTQRTATS